MSTHRGRFSSFSPIFCLLFVEINKVPPPRWRAEAASGTIQNREGACCVPLDMKQMIADQLAVLLRRKSLDKITVKELVEACGISRQSFYYHFRDLMDVVEWQQKQLLAQGIQNSLAVSDPLQAIRGLVQENSRNKVLLDRLLSSDRRAEIERMLVETMETYLAEMLRRRGGEKALSPADSRAVLRFYASGVVGLMLSAPAANEEEQETLVRQIYRLLSAQLTLA